MNEFTKRELLAADVLHAIVSAGWCDPETKITHFIPARIACRKAVEYADTLLKELSSPPHDREALIDQLLQASGD